jgi:hypothetical protein
MPDYSLLSKSFRKFDPEHSAGRFNPHLAVAILAPEPDPSVYNSREDVVVQQAGDWVLGEDEALGKPRAVDGSIGRGAEGWAPVVEWGVNAIGQGIIDLVLAASAVRILRRLRRRSVDRGGDEPSDPPRFYISRGMAAAVAADHVASTLGDPGPLEVEGVEEPSSIAGAPAIETSYVGFEPWVVLLRNVQAERRYYVVVAPDGEVMGDITTPLLEFEAMFLRPVGDDNEQGEGNAG